MHKLEFEFFDSLGLLIDILLRITKSLVPKMASASVSRFVHTETRSSNVIKKTVFLQEWWLVKAEKPVEGKIVAVAGIPCRVKNQAMRQFSSAPILRAKDIFVLETTDGVCVMLEGVINQTRTLQNGFTADVFEQFIFGFPPQWESFSRKCMIEKYSTNLFSRSPDSDKNVSGVQGSKNIPVEKEQHINDCDETLIENALDYNVDFGVEVNAHTEASLDNTTSQHIATGSSLFKEDDFTASPREITNISVSARNDESIRKCSSKFIGGGNEDLSVTKNQEKDNPNNKSSNSERYNLTAETTSIIPKKSKEGAKKQSVNKEASASNTSAKRVLNYESPVALEKAITRTKQRRCKMKVNMDTENTPRVKSKKTRNSGKKSSTCRKNAIEETPARQEKREIILSPESVSNKRSRSGRLLLPTLEFWRNQTVVYDADRHISGIKQDQPSDQPPRGSKSKQKMKRKRA